MRLGILHPGAMGTSVGKCLLTNGHEVGWVSQGRSPASVQRAAAFQPFKNMDEIAAWADGLISVCPPHAALEVAQAVHATGYQGFFVDANAIAPSTALRVAETLGLSAHVDGGIIGPPPQERNTTRLYLSGQHAALIADWFQGSALVAVVIEPEGSDDSHVAASVLKMAYAAYTKGSAALLLLVNALAASGGVLTALQTEWHRSQPGLVDRSEATAAMVSGKAWRFVGEMYEISETASAAGLPDQFHVGAAEVFERLAHFKDLPPQTLAQILETLATPK